jgi:hypothetical protein
MSGSNRGRCCYRRRRSAPPAVVDAEGQSATAAGPPDRWNLPERFETGEIGPDLFRHACMMGLEGLVSKRRESSYRGGRFDRWVKVKKRQHPAFARVLQSV